MSFPLPLSALTRQPRSRQLQQASGSGALRVVRRLQALRALADTQSVQAGAERLHLGQHTLRDSRNALLLQGVSSLGSPRPPGRPNPCTPSPRRELAALSTAGPQATGYPSGGWHTPMRHDLVQRRCGAASPPPSLATLLHPLGFSSPQARVVSAHLPQPQAWHGVGPRGRRWDITRASAQPCGSVAMPPAGPTGARSATPGPPQASTPQCPPGASAKAPRCVASSPLARDSFSPQGRRGGFTPRALWPFGAPGCPTRDVTSW